MGMFRKWFQGFTTATTELTAAQRRLYAMEATENFRDIATLFGRSSPHTLTSADLAPIALQLELSEIGQYAEVAFGRLSPDFIWANLEALLQPDMPLDGYTALRGSVLISPLCGSVAEVQGYLAYRPESKQLVTAFSGTASVLQTLHEFDIRMVAYPGATNCTIHAGFWRMYGGLRHLALEAWSNAMNTHDVREVVVTGHSLGAAMCYMFALDVLEESEQQGAPRLTTVPLKLALFGCPMIGNAALAQHWRDLVANRSKNGRALVAEHAVKAYNDGVPLLPPQMIGFRQLAQAPSYFVDGCLYHIPPSESECSFFKVEFDNDNADPTRQRTLDHPLGGHNYYNNRDMEKMLRRMDWLELASGQEGWKERYESARLREQNRFDL